MFVSTQSTAKTAILTVIVLALAVQSSQGRPVNGQEARPESGSGDGVPAANGPRFHITEYPNFDARWRTVSHPMGELAIGRLPPTDLEIWTPPLVRGHTAAGYAPFRDVPGVFVTVRDDFHADPLWSHRTVSPDGRVATDAASWGRRESYYASLNRDKAADRADACHWKRMSHERVPGVNAGGPVAWDVPHSPFVINIGFQADVPAMLRYRREYRDGAWKYFTEVVRAYSLQEEGKPFAVLDGMADSPAAWGPYLLLRRFTGDGDASQLVLFTSDSELEEAGKDYYTNGNLNGPFVLADPEGGPFVYSKPVWTMLSPEREPGQPFPGNVPQFAVVARPAQGKHGNGTLLLADLTMTQRVTLVDAPKDRDEETSESDAGTSTKVTRAVTEVESVSFSPLSGKAFAGLEHGPEGNTVFPGLSDTLGFKPDVMEIRGHHVDATIIGLVRRDHQAKKAEWMRKQAAGEEPGPEPEDLLAGEKIPANMGGVLGFMVENPKRPGFRQAVLLRLAHLPGAREAEEGEAREPRRSLLNPAVKPDAPETQYIHHRSTELPIGALWPVTEVVGEPEFEVLAGDRVYRVLPDGSVAVPAALEGDLPHPLPQPMPESPMRVVGAQLVGGGHLVVWWSRGGVQDPAKHGDAGSALAIPSVADVEAFAGAPAPASNRAFAFTVFRDANFGLLWPHGEVSEIHRTTNLRAAAQVVSDSWVAENVLMAKRAMAARDAKRLRNTVLIYGFDVRIESDQIKNKKGDVVEFYRELPGSPPRAMIRTEDDFSGEWTVKAWRAATASAAEEAWIADDAGKEFRESRGSTAADMASLARARRLLLLADADQPGALSSVEYRKGFPVDPESGKAWNTRSFIRRGADGSIAHLYFDADGDDHELVMARLDFPFASKDGGRGGSSIELWFDGYTDLRDLNNLGKKAEALRVPEKVRGFTPRTAELRFVATFKPSVQRMTLGGGKTAIEAGFNRPGLELAHFGKEYDLGKSQDD